MTSLLPQVIEGHVVPGVINPAITRKWITSEPYGPPIKQTPVVQPATKPPLKLGDEQHQDVMGALQKIMVQQKSTQMTEAIPGFRDWR